jgi:predicted permease
MMTWLGRLFSRHKLESELDREMQFHLDAAVADHMRAGLTRDQAMRRARIDFGGPEQMKEAVRDARGTRWVEDLVHDVRFALRGMRRSPAFATAAVLTIAIGVGANTAVWSIMEALMRRALPVANPETLAAVKRVGLGDDQYLVSYPLVQQVQRALGATAEVASMGSLVRAYATTGNERPEAVTALAVSGNFFDVLGLHPLRGRLIAPSDDQAQAGSPVVVISDAYWQRRFGRDPAAIGTSVRVNGYPVTIVGVAPAGFGGLTIGNPVDMWTPLTMHYDLHLRGNNRSSNGDGQKPWIPQREISWLTMITRAEPSAVARVNQLANGAFRADQAIELAQYDSVTAAFAAKERLALEPIPRGFSSLRAEFRDPLNALLAGVALILLITCANLAGLVLARGESRSHEMAIRSSLGAMSGRLARQLATESLTLALIGGVVGVIMAQWMIKALLKLASGGANAIPLDASLSGSVLLFAFGVTLLAGLIVGLAPALRVRSFQLYATFRTGGRVSSGSHRLPLGRLLVAAQIALALILVTSAGVFARTFANFISVDAGYDRESVVTARVDVRAAGYTVEQLPGEYRRLLDAASGVPGVQSAGLAAFGIANGGRRTSGFAVGGHPLAPNQNIAQENYVTPGYFHTVGMRLLRGRDFTSADTPDKTPRAAIVSEAFAKHFFGSTDIVGRRFGYGNGAESPDGQEVIGVVSDARFNGLKDPEPWLVYHPLAQGPTEYVTSIDVRATGNVEPVIAALRSAIGAADRNLPVREVVKLGDLVERGLSREKLVARLASSFGILALVLAAIGLYGVISYSVARRTNEMGVRLALGASPGGVSWLVLRDSLALVVIGLVAGVALWFPVLGFTRSLLYNVSPHDPKLLGMSLGALMLVGVLAGLIPAMRASRIDPIEAIRAD